MEIFSAYLREAISTWLQISLCLLLLISGSRLGASVASFHRIFQQPHELCILLYRFADRKLGHKEVLIWGHSACTGAGSRSIPQGLCSPLGRATQLSTYMSPWYKFVKSLKYIGNFSPPKGDWELCKVSLPPAQALQKGRRRVHLHPSADIPLSSTRAGGSSLTQPAGSLPATEWDLPLCQQASMIQEVAGGQCRYLQSLSLFRRHSRHSTQAISEGVGPGCHLPSPFIILKAPKRHLHKRQTGGARAFRGARMKCWLIVRWEESSRGAQVGDAALQAWRC